MILDPFSDSMVMADLSLDRLQSRRSSSMTCCRTLSEMITLV